MSLRPYTPDANESSIPDLYIGVAGVRRYANEQEWRANNLQAENEKLEKERFDPAIRLSAKLAKENERLKALLQETLSYIKATTPKLCPSGEMSDLGERIAKELEETV